MESPTHERSIHFFPGNSDAPITITFNIPDDWDDEEYINEYLDGILNDFFQYNCDWEFI